MKKEYVRPTTQIFGLGPDALLDGIGFGSDNQDAGAKHFEPKGRRKRAMTTASFDDDLDDDWDDDDFWGTTFRRYNPWED